MIRSILVPLDGSGFSEQALPTAAAIARRESAALHLIGVHVPAAILPFGGSTPVDADFERRVRADADARLERLARSVAHDYGVPASHALLDGPVVETIDRYARDMGADLITMTTHGRGGLRRAWLGSVADGLVRRTRLPVLLIRPRRRPTGRLRLAAFRRVLLPLDGSGLAEQVIPAALAVAGPTAAEFLLLRIVPPLDVPQPWVAEYAVYVQESGVRQRLDEAEAYLDHVAGRLRRDGVVAATRAVVQGQAAIAILEEARRVRADLIAMATHGRGGVVRMVIGSVADTVLRRAPAPLLLLRPETT
ncbi:MAG TPA: universal stress protein [Longimicrobiales bacterium]